MKKTKAVNIDVEIHKVLKAHAAKLGILMNELVDRLVKEGLKKDEKTA